MPNFIDLEAEFDSIKEYSYNDLKHDKFVSHFKPRRRLERDLNYSFNIRMKKPASAAISSVSSSSKANSSSNNSSSNNSSSNNSSSKANSSVSSSHSSSSSSSSSATAVAPSDSSGRSSHHSKRNVVLLGQEGLDEFLRERKKRRVLKESARLLQSLEGLAQSEMSVNPSVGSHRASADVSNVSARVNVPSDAAFGAASDTTSNTQVATAVTAGPRKKKKVYLVPMDDSYRQKMLDWVEKRQARSAESTEGGSATANGGVEKRQARSAESTEGGSATANGGSENASRMPKDDLDGSSGSAYVPELRDGSKGSQNGAEQPGDCSHGSSGSKSASMEPRNGTSEPSYASGSPQKPSQEATRSAEQSAEQSAAGNSTKSATKGAGSNKPQSDSEHGAESPDERDRNEPAKFRELVLSESENEDQIPPCDPAQVSQHDVSLAKSLILQQIQGFCLPHLPPSLSDPYKEVCSLFEQTVFSSESHTAFLMGPSGTGKTLIVERALESMRSKYPKTFIVVRLGGDMHRSDHAAIREFSRQLDIQVNLLSMSVAETTFEQRSISDTFDNILTALSKPDHSLFDNAPRDTSRSPNTSSPDSPSNERKEETIRILIIIDNIEEYTRTPRQTLLYNLLDLCHSSKIPICLLGITQNLAIRENLEKRVRSRFSQRVIETKRPASLDMFCTNAEVVLTVDPAKYGIFDDPKYPEAWNSVMKGQLRGQSQALPQEQSAGQTKAAGQFTGLRSVAAAIFASTRDYKHLLNCCCLPVTSTTVHEPFPQPANFELAFHNSISNSINSQVESLSEMEKLLLIAGARWVEKSGTKQVNFKLAYQEYEHMIKTFNLEATTLTSKTSAIDNVSLAGIKVTRSIMTPKALKDIWATLYRYGLLFDLITSNSEVNAHNNHNRNKEINLADDRMVQVDVSLDELGHMVPDTLKRYTRL